MYSYSFAPDKNNRVSWGPKSKRMVAGIYLTKGMKNEGLADIDYLIEHPADGVDVQELKRLKRQLENDG